MTEDQAINILNAVLDGDFSATPEHYRQAYIVWFGSEAPQTAVDWNSGTAGPTPAQYATAYANAHAQQSGSMALPLIGLAAAAWFLLKK